MLANNALAQNAFTCISPISIKEKTNLLEEVAANFNALSSLKADFEQNSILLGFSQSNSSKGQLIFKKIGMMDWHYISPEEQRFITDGKTVWFYQKALNQVTISNFKNTFSTDLPVSFLLGLSSLDKEFKLKSTCMTYLGQVLKLEPVKQDPNLSKFELVVDSNSKSPLAVKVTDVGGNDTEIILKNVRRDINIDNAKFEYRIPRGVDVINNNTANSS